MNAPKFIQIVAAGTGVSGFVSLYALGEDGIVYRYKEGEGRGWVALSNAVIQSG